MKDWSALPPGLFRELSPDEVHITARVVECGGLLDGFALDWHELQLEQGLDAVSSLDLLNGRRAWDILAQYTWYAVVGLDLLDRVTIGITHPMEKVVVLLATWSPINQLLAWFKRFAKLALGLAGLDLVIPCPVEAENASPCLLDYGSPLVKQFAAEVTTGRQSILIEGFTISTCGSVGILARWTWWRWVLARGMGLLGAVWWLARALGNLMPHLPAAATPILDIWPL